MAPPRKTLAILIIIMAAAGCGGEMKATKEKAKSVARKVADTVDEVATPTKADTMTPAELERQRFDQRWRELESCRQQQAAEQQRQQEAATAAAAAEAARFQFVTGKKETFKKLDANAINNAPVNVPITGDVHGPSVLKAQVFLDRNHYSVGALDGRWGRNSAISVWWWQRGHGLASSGDVDEATFRSLASAAGNVPAVVSYTITDDDTKGPFVSIPDSPYEKARLDCLCYESLKEKLAEKFHSSQDFLDVLNPDVKFSELKGGDTIVVPNVRPALTNDTHDVAKIVISLAGNSLSGFDANGHLNFHAPTTVGNGYDPSPNETVKLVKIVDHPHFHYDPTLYHEVPDSMPDAHMSPGPNSPVGVVWLALSKQHYGIHGTPDPESIGYVSSHGCIRLTNWDAAELQHRVSEGIPVSFVDVSRKGLPEVAKK